MSSVRALESVWHSIMTAIEGDIIASTNKDSRFLLSVALPWPRAMAFSIRAFGNPDFFAKATSVDRRGFEFGSGPYTVKY